MRHPLFEIFYSVQRQYHSSPSKSLPHDQRPQIWEKIADTDHRASCRCGSKTPHHWPISCVYTGFKKMYDENQAFGEINIIWGNFFDKEEIHLYWSQYKKGILIRKMRSEKSCSRSIFGELSTETWEKVQADKVVWGIFNESLRGSPSWQSCLGDFQWKFERNSRLARCPTDLSYLY